VVGLIILIIISSLLSGRKSGSTQPIALALARNAETLRVTTLAQTQLRLQDPQTQALAATVNASLTSDKAQLLSYLAINHAKVGTSQLAIDTDRSTDANFQTASQNNSLDSAYVAYLKTALPKYQTDLINAYNAAGSNGKKLLSSSYDSTKALLATPPLKS
jgi:DNA-binding response OmpR family regulator